MVPYGQAIVQSLQPTHRSSTTSLAPAVLMVMAPTGQAVMHQPSAHWVHVYGAYDVCPSNGDTRMTDLAGWYSPVCMYEQASSHRRHPVHRSGTIFRILLIAGLASLLLPCFAFLAAPLEPADELVEREGGHRHHLHRAARAQLHGHTRNGRVVGRLHDRDEVVRTEDGVLRDDPGAHALHVRVDFSDPARPLAQHLLSGLRQAAQHVVETHGREYSIHDMGGPERVPQTPRRSSRPGEAGALLEKTPSTPAPGRSRA